MSFHYTFQLTLRLQSDLSQADLARIRYLVRGEGGTPEGWPQVPGLEGALPREPLSFSYRDFVAGSYIAQFWEQQDSDGTILDRGIHLHLPGNKLEGVYQELLVLARWLASLSPSVGHVGAVTCEDDGARMPNLFFVFERELHMAVDLASVPIMSVASGKRYLPA